MRSSEETEILTVAAVRERPDGGGFECLFNERQQIFTASAAVRADAAVERLRGAVDRNLPVRAVLNPRRETVVSVAAPSERELREFARRSRVICRARRRSPTASRSSTCGTAATRGRSRCARSSRTDTATAEKVFSFANQGMDRLAVRANKWGGCCVTWWYHVAPLVRVRMRINLGPFNLQFTLAMVIDPGMFDKPVLLSTWLMAQEEATCSATANVSMFSIQPGSAYTPANLAGTMFNTDPAYTQTHQTLTGYKNATTCP